MLLSCRDWARALAVVLMFNLAGCGSKTDDEIWLERIHTSKVYLYAALKIVIVEPDRDDDVRATRKLLDELSANNMPNAASDPAATAQQALTLGRALWKLRSLGEAEVAKGRGSGLLVIPSIGDATKAPELSLPEAEHGFLLLLLLASKLDSRSPLPVPPEVLLYEAYMAGETPLPDPLLAGLVTSAQTSVTAENELCDVAGRYSDRLAALGEKTGSGAVFLHLLSTLVAHDAKGYGADNAMLLALPWGLRVLAHGRAALCFDGRKQADKARVEWDRVVALAAEVGIPEADLALIQSYAAYRAKDWPQTRIHLHRASNSSLLTPEEREHFVQMAERFDEKDPGALESTLDRAFVARTLLGIADQRLRKAGVYDVLLQLPKVVATRVALEALSHPALSVEPAGLWQRVRGLWDSSVGE